MEKNIKHNSEKDFSSLYFIVVLLCNVDTASSYCEINEKKPLGRTMTFSCNIN